MIMQTLTPERKIQQVHITNKCHYIGITRIQTYVVKPANRTAEEIQLEKAHRIARYVFIFFDVELKFMLKKCNKADVVRAKRVSIYLISLYCNLVDDQKAVMFNLDRSTVVYHRKTCNDLIWADKRFAEVVEKIKRDLKLK